MERNFLDYTVIYLHQCSGKKFSARIPRKNVVLLHHHLPRCIYTFKALVQFTSDGSDELSEFDSLFCHDGQSNHFLFFFLPDWNFRWLWIGIDLHHAGCYSLQSNATSLVDGHSRISFDSSSTDDAGSTFQNSIWRNFQQRHSFPNDAAFGKF